jgi:hypothetical protein
MISELEHMRSPCTPAAALRLAGTVVAMGLAVPHVRLFTRALFRHAEADVLQRLDTEGCNELLKLEELLLHRNGRPFIDERWEAELWVDTGASGWGAHLCGRDLAGHLPVEMIGSTSSALREMTGLALALKDPEVPDLLRGRTVVRVWMDASAAVANMCNGGGTSQLEHDNGHQGGVPAVRGAGN